MASVVPKQSRTVIAQRLDAKVIASQMEIASRKLDVKASRRRAMVIVAPTVTVHVMANAVMVTEAQKVVRVTEDRRAIVHPMEIVVRTATVLRHKAKVVVVRCLDSLNCSTAITMDDSAAMNSIG